mmetsp:Transcript_54134/g.101094  ORF Transcript_54134/g.101094 Transcript_54134/m.101094 type:complete len:172 (+) Transcript_54134:157-672(+)
MKFVPSLLVMMCFFDIWLNAEIDYSLTWRIEMVFAARFVIVFLNFALLLMVLFNTYPIQVGLFDIVAKQARPVLCVHVVNAALTLALLSVHIQTTGLTSKNMVELWLSEEYEKHMWLLVVQRLTSIVYYLLTYRSCIEFLSPKYTDKAAWVTIAQDRFNLRPLPNVQNAYF